MNNAAPLVRHGLLALVALCAQSAVASNTANTRSFTSEWQCDNGRSLLVNAHPARPREDAWLTYAGQRIEVSLQPVSLQPVSPQPGTKDEAQRFASNDGKVVWARQKNSSMLQFKGVLEQPVACTLKSTTQSGK